MDYKEARETLTSESQALGLRIECEFVPLSRSRNAKEKWPTVNWRVRLMRSDRLVWEGDFQQGIAHLKTPRGFDPSRVDGSNAMRQACEKGIGFWDRTVIPDVRAVEPGLADILHALLLDAGAIDEGSFEDWASSLGYDPNSRKAESIWRACIETGLKLRAALGDERFRRFQSLAQEM